MKNIVRSAFLLLAFLLAAEAFAEPIGRLPAFSRSLAWDNESKLLAAPLALEGFALARLPSEASPEMDVRHFPDWPSLAALPAGEGRFLLAGRFGTLRLIGPDDEGEYTEINSWETEGVPTDLHWDGKRLLMAGGPAGLLLYDWEGPGNEPYLRGRYPFVDYTKEIAVGSEGIVYLADNFDTGLQVLRTEDIMRPEGLATERRDFVDSVAREGDLVAIAARRVGTYLFDMSNPAAPREIGFIRALPTSDRGGFNVRRVDLDKLGHLIVCEGAQGARLFQLTPGEKGLSVKSLGRYPAGRGSAGEAHFLPDGRFVVVGHGGELYLEELVEEE